MKELIPLQVGNGWNFKRSYFDTLGNVVGTEAESLRIIGDTTISGRQWFYQYYFGHHLAYRNVNGGTMIRLVSDSSDGKEAVIYKYPNIVGETYSFPIIFFAGFKAWIVDTVSRCTIISVDTIISVPAGVFHCYQFRITRLGYYSWQDEFLSPQYGWIKKDFYTFLRQKNVIFKANTLEAVVISLN